MTDPLDLEAIRRSVSGRRSLPQDHFGALISEVERLREDNARKDKALREIAEMQGIPPGWEHVNPSDWPGGIEDAAWSCMDDHYVHRENMRSIARAALSDTTAQERT